MARFSDRFQNRYSAKNVRKQFLHSGWLMPIILIGALQARGEISSHELCCALAALPIVIC